MNSFSISDCTYDGTSGDQNPLCYVLGTVNGKNIFASAFFAYLIAANAAGQVQQALTAIMFNWYANVYGYQFTPWPLPISFPQFPLVDVQAQHTTGPYPQPPVVVTQALISAWTA